MFVFNFRLSSAICRAFFLLAEIIVHLKLTAISSATAVSLIFHVRSARIVGSVRLHPVVELDLGPGLFHQEQRRMITFLCGCGRLLSRVCLLIKPPRLIFFLARTRRIKAASGRVEGEVYPKRPCRWLTFYLKADTPHTGLCNLHAPRSR